MKRFQRQTILSEVGEKGQEILLRSKVLVVGAGGLGHPAIQYLASMGIGTIGVIDGDSVEESNLHRQVLFDYNDVSQNKAEIVKRKIDSKCSGVQIIAYPYFLTGQNGNEIFKDYDVVVDGTDNFSTKFLINDLCLINNKPMVYGSISNFEGQVSVFCSEDGPCYRCLIPDVPKAKIENCAEAGVIGVLPGIVGSIQALEVVKVLLQNNLESSSLVPLKGELCHFDFADNTFRKLMVSKNENCFCSYRSKIQIHTDSKSESCRFENKGLLLDVREKLEWDQFHLPQSEHWPLSLIEQGVFPQHLRGVEVMTICKSGIRAEKAFEILKQNGYEKISYSTSSIFVL